MMRTICFVVAILSQCLVVALAQTSSLQFVSRQEESAALVTVSGVPITADDLEYYSISRSIPEESRPAARERLLNQLVDRQLMRSYLEKQRATPSTTAIDAQVARIHELIRKGGDEPAEVLSRLGFDEKRLRAAVALPLAWQIYVRRVVVGSQLREYFGKHKQEFDGTEVRASQIFLKLASDADEESIQQAKEKLMSIRKDIADEKMTFAEAAKKYSAAPSAKKGGDVGFFPYRGKMLVEFSRVAFPLKKGDVSEPFRTRFGYHLLMVTDRRAGQLSLEDVRGLVYNRLAQQAWTKLVAEQRKQAKIEWADAAE